MSSDRVKVGCVQFAQYLRGNVGKLRWLAKMQGVKLDEYTDKEILEIIKGACDIVLNANSTFEFKPIYQKAAKT